MGVIPVIRAQPGEAAEMVARTLHKMIQAGLAQCSVLSAQCSVLSAQWDTFPQSCR